MTLNYEKIVESLDHTIKRKQLEDTNTYRKQPSRIAPRNKYHGQESIHEKDEGQVHDAKV